MFNLFRSLRTKKEYREVLQQREFNALHDWKEVHSASEIDVLLKEAGFSAWPLRPSEHTFDQMDINDASIAQMLWRQKGNCRDAITVRLVYINVDPPATVGGQQAIILKNMYKEYPDFQYILGGKRPANYPASISN